MSESRNSRADGKAASAPLVLRTVVAALGLLAGGVVQAQQAAHPGLTDRWTFQLGAYWPKVDTTASLNGSGGVVNREVSFEDDLNLTDRKTLPALLAAVRLGERWKIEAEYFSLHRSGSRAVSRTISWGDNTYPVGTTVHSEFDSDIYRLSVGYSFVKDDRRELGVVLGVHVTDFNTSLSAAGIGSSSGDTLAPLPTIGLYGAYAFSPKWLLTGRVDYFTLSYDEYEGTLVNLGVALEYRVSRHFGVGLGYRHVSYDVDITKTRYTGSIDYRFNGPILFGVASF